MEAAELPRAVLALAPPNQALLGLALPQPAWLALATHCPEPIPLLQQEPERVRAEPRQVVVRLAVATSAQALG